RYDTGTASAGPVLHRSHRSLLLAVTIEDSTAAAPAASRGLSARLPRMAPYLQALPLTLILGLFLLLPIIMIAVVSFWDYDFAMMYPDFMTLNYEETLGS